MDKTRADRRGSLSGKAAVFRCAISLLLLVGLSACGSGSSSEQDSLSAALEIVKEETGIENSSYVQCLLDGFSDGGFEEARALAAINVAHSSGDSLEPLSDSVNLIVVGCVPELSSDEQEQLALRPAGDGVVRGEDPILDGLFASCVEGSNEACAELFWLAAPDSEYEYIALDCAGRCPETIEFMGSRYGDNDLLDGLYRECEAGLERSCAEMYQVSAIGSAYSLLGNECAGRCVDTPHELAKTKGDHPYLDGLWNLCAEGSEWSCVELYWVSALDSEYEAFGDVCGGRCETKPISEAFTYGESVYFDDLWDQCEAGDLLRCEDLTWGAWGTEYADFGWDQILAAP